MKYLPEKFPFKIIDNFFWECNGVTAPRAFAPARRIGGIKNLSLSLASDVTCFLE
jgi:hypothetical protein